ncbi:MAG: long-chain fatty acid transporter [Bacteroidota bacterium]|nr:long-chain fatty acid transporter [Bacteroidota bacterium]
MKILTKLIAISACLLFPIVESFSQGPYGYYNDALTFSQTQLGGTARVQGMGGVQISLGGDVSNILSNPAGLGLFNRSEISISPSASFQNSSSQYFNSSTDVFTSNFSIENVGIVFNRSKDARTEGDWRGGSFGISYTRTNNLNNEFQYRATNPNTSILDYFLDASTGISEDDISDFGLVGLAYENYLINPIGGGNYDSFIEGFPQTQQETVRTSGRQSQFNVSYGGNYADRIYFGGGIGFTSLNYRNEKVYSESFVGEPLNNMLITENFRVNGAGVNATFGVIVRPNDLVRFGASIVTPTINVLNDESGSTMSTLYNNYAYDPGDGTIILRDFSLESALLVSEYTLKTPLRLNGGAALFFSKAGFISADVEYLNYRGNRFNARNFSMAEDNQVIQDIYQPVVNVKLGGEYRFNMFRLRAGAGYYSDPYAGNTEISRSRLNLSAGAGIRLPTFYVDLAVLNDSFNTVYTPYEASVGDLPIVETLNSMTRAVLTLGFNF